MDEMAHYLARSVTRIQKVWVTQVSCMLSLGAERPDFWDQWDMHSGRTADRNNRTIQRYRRLAQLIHQGGSSVVFLWHHLAHCENLRQFMISHVMQHIVNGAKAMSIIFIAVTKKSFHPCHGVFGR